MLQFFIIIHTFFTIDSSYCKIYEDILIDFVYFHDTDAGQPSESVMKGFPEAVKRGFS